MPAEVQPLQAHVVKLATAFKPAEVQPIQTLGGKVEVGTSDVPFRTIRDNMKVTIGGESHETRRETNYIDYLKEDRQIEAMLDAGLKANAFSEGDLEKLGINVRLERVTPGREGVKFTLPPNNKLQKADVMDLMLQSMRKTDGFTENLLGVVTRDVEKISTAKDHQGKPIAARPIGKADMANAILVAGNELLDDYLADLKYSKHGFAMGEKQPERRQVGSGVVPTYNEMDEQEILRAKTGEQNMFTKPGEFAKAGPSGEMERLPAWDMIFGQAMLDTFTPAEYQMQLTQMQLDMENATDRVVRDQKSHDITNLRQDIYAAILMSHRVKGFDQESIGSELRYDRIKDIADKMTAAGGPIDLYNSSSLQDANRASMAHIFATSLHMDEGRVFDIVNNDFSKNMNHAGFVTRENQLVDMGIPRNLAPAKVYDEWFKTFMTELQQQVQGKLEIQPGNPEVAVLQRIFIQRLNTEKRLSDRVNVAGHKGSSDKALYGIEAATMNIRDNEGEGLKGIELMWRRTKSPAKPENAPSAISREKPAEKAAGLTQTTPGEQKLIDAGTRKSAMESRLSAVEALNAANAAEALAARDASDANKEAARVARNKAVEAEQAARQAIAEAPWEKTEDATNAMALIDQVKAAPAKVESAEQAKTQADAARAQAEQARAEAANASARLNAEIEKAKREESQANVDLAKQIGEGRLRRTIQATKRRIPIFGRGARADLSEANAEVGRLKYESQNAAREHGAAVDALHAREEEQRKAIAAAADAQKAVDQARTDAARLVEQARQTAQ